MNSNRVRAIIINNNEVLFIKRTKNGETKFVLPGGKVEENESLESAVIREVKEETSLQSEIASKLTSITDNNNLTHHIYLFKYISGTPKIDSESPEITLELGMGVLYKPEWVDISEISNLNIWPNEVKDFLIEYLHSSN